MGTTNVPFEKLNAFTLLAESDYQCPDSILSDFKLNHKEAVNLSYFDELQLNFFTPIYRERYSEYYYSRINAVNKN
ncbi:MAG TPA: hypothetical protein ENO18_06945 [Caldithrix sp.]|nr:hypothetical protein [Caldithrix sp.]